MRIVNKPIVWQQISLGLSYQWSWQHITHLAILTEDLFNDHNISSNNLCCGSASLAALVPPCDR